MGQTILITGGAGYIGSHTTVQALNEGHNVIILDNLLNSNPIVLNRIANLTDRQVSFVHGDVRNLELLDQIFHKYKVNSVIHFAGLKAVAESAVKPLDYYDANVNGTLKLLEAMSKADVKKIIFSSSATVYGEQAAIPYIETETRGTTTSPYGTTKATVEQILEELCLSDSQWSAVLLRYFNPIGAHPSGAIGEDPKGIPNNLMPFLTQVAVGKRDQLSIYGSDYPTKDGTCERDYLHVIDLADGHIAALSALRKTGCHIFNLGTGRPVSVLEMVNAFQRVTGVQLKYRFTDRRAGDLPAFWANSDKARDILGWEAHRPLETMITDAWNWQKLNPEGYS